MNKSTWILGSLAVVLGLIYFLTKVDNHSLHIKRLKMPAFVLEKIDKIEILGQDQAKLSKNDGLWFIDIGKNEPLLVKADAANVENMLLSAQGLRHAHYVTNLEEKYEELGLGQEVITINLYEKDKLLWSLLLGKAATGSTRYAKLADDPNVYAIKGSFWQLVRNGINDWRDRQIFSMTEDQVSSLSIKGKEGSLEVERGPNGFSFSEKQKFPSGFKADQVALLDLVHAVVNLNASDFIDAAPILFDPKLKISLQSGLDEQSIEIYADSDDYVVKRAKDGQAFRISMASFNTINKSLDDVRDFSLLDFDKKSVVGLKIRHGQQQIILSKGAKDWQIKEPKLAEGFLFDKSSVDGMIAMLSGLDASRALNSSDKPENPDWLKNWLVFIELEHGSRVLYATPNLSNSDEMLIKGQGEPYVIKASRLKTLFQGINAFKKEDYDLPKVDDAPGFKDLPEDLKRKLGKEHQAP